MVNWCNFSLNTPYFLVFNSASTNSAFSQTTTFEIPSTQTLSAENKTLKQQQKEREHHKKKVEKYRNYVNLSPWLKCRVLDFLAMALLNEWSFQKILIFDNNTMVLLSKNRYISETALLYWLFLFDYGYFKSNSRHNKTKNSNYYIFS